MNFFNGSPYSDPQSDGLTLGASTSIPKQMEKDCPKMSPNPNPKGQISHSKPTFQSNNPGC
jgi:hypothetical protein